MIEENLGPSGNEDPPAVHLYDVSASQPLQVEVSETEDIRTWENLRDPSPEAGGPAPDQTTPPPPETPEA